jgi:hypothetical protein
MIWILALASAWLYRVGGAGREEIKYADSQYRDIGCPVVVLVALVLMGFTWYLALASALCVLGLVRTYHDWTGSDNFYLHGLGIGLSMAPLYWSGVAWFAIAAYAVILGLSMGVWHWLLEKFKVPVRVWWDELFRGFLIISCLRLLNI